MLNCLVARLALLLLWSTLVELSDAVVAEHVAHTRRPKTEVVQIAAGANVVRKEPRKSSNSRHLPHELVQLADSVDYDYGGDFTKPESLSDEFKEPNEPNVSDPFSEFADKGEHNQLSHLALVDDLELIGVEGHPFEVTVFVVCLAILVAAVDAHYKWMEVGRKKKRVTARTVLQCKKNPKMKFHVLEKKRVDEHTLYLLRGHEGWKNLAGWGATLGLDHIRERTLDPQADSDDADSDGEEYREDSLDPDMYSLAIVSIVHDYWQIRQDDGSVHKELRIARISTNLLLLFILILIQVVLLLYVMEFSCGGAVARIREAYDHFEKHMYDGHVTTIDGGFLRGEPIEKFNLELFHSMTEKLQKTCCRFPLSQPHFLSFVLFIWTIHAVGELRVTTRLLNRLIFSLPTVPLMKDSIKINPRNSEKIVGLTKGVKAFICCCLIVPRYIIALFLAEVGCRWLTATTNWESLVMNGVGLKFLLLLNVLMYKALVPERSAREVRRCRFMILGDGGTPSPHAYFADFGWVVLSVAWVIMYVYSFQGVLPYYRFDIQAACHEISVSKGMETLDGY